MEYREYMLYSKEYVDQYCIDLNPRQEFILDGRHRAEIWKITGDAIRNFGATSIGYRIFFKTAQDRSKFKTWMELKWQ